MIWTELFYFTLSICCLQDEVKRLKQEHNEILDMHGKLAVATEMVPSSHSRSHSASTLEGKASLLWNIY